MPELPEVETIARELHARLAGQTIDGVDVLRPDVLRNASPDQLRAACVGQRIDRVWRRGKTGVLSLTAGRHLLIQPRFTGSVLVEDRSSAEAPPAFDEYATIQWRLSGGGRFWYRDVRRLGTVTLANNTELEAYSQRLGFEPLDPAFDADRLSGLLRASRSAIKRVLMDQRVVAGIGNIYANEGLWRAGIDPSREARSLSRAEVERLHEALTTILAASIQARGTTFRDYRDPSNRVGGYAAQLLAYGRGGSPCARCGASLVETHAVDGRSTVFCHRCQH